MLNNALTKAICNIKSQWKQKCITLLFWCPLTTRWLVYCTIDTMFVFTYRKVRWFGMSISHSAKIVKKLTQIYWIYLLNVVLRMIYSSLLVPFRENCLLFIICLFLLTSWKFWRNYEVNWVDFLFKILQRSLYI